MHVLTQRLCRFVLLASVGFSLAGCRTFNTLLHNDASQEVPLSYDYEVALKSGMFADQPVMNLKKACRNQRWHVIKVYFNWFSGWHGAVKCKS